LRVSGAQAEPNLFGLEGLEPLAKLTLDVLDWEKNRLSLETKIRATTYMGARDISVEGDVAKLGLRKLRVDLRPALTSRDGSVEDLPEPLRLGEYTTIYNFDEGETLILFPAKKAYVVVTRDEAKRWMDKVSRAADLKKGKAKITSREALGSEEISGHLCEKFRFGIEMADGSQGVVLCWLAADLNRFPLRSEVEVEKKKGGVVRTVTEFSEVYKRPPHSTLFTVPEGFKEYRTLRQLLRGDRIPKILRRPKKR
jgi:hypothetical protein